MKLSVFLLAGLGPMLAWAAAAPSERVSIALSMQDNTALAVRYSVPPGCTSLRFLNAGIGASAASAMRQDWTSPGNCATVTADGIRFHGTCRSATIVVPAVVRDLDRVYPWAHPLDDAIYSHTSAYAVQPDCGRVQWQFDARKGAVVVDGKLGGPSVSAGTGQEVAYSPVVFLKGAAVANARKRVYIDRRFSGETAAFLKQSTGLLSAYFARRYQPLKVDTPFIVAVPTETGKGWRGDVANKNTMRLMLAAAPSGAERKQLEGFIAHETSHLLQPRSIDDALTAESTLINEGGAEFMSWLATAELGWADGATSAARAEDAVNACILGAGTQPWASNPDRNWRRIPYDCGLTFHLIALANDVPGQSAVARLGSYYADAAAGKPANFAHALECGSAMACNAQWLVALLGKERTVASVIGQYSHTSSWLKPADTWNGGHIEAVARSLLGRMMAFDCQGQISMFNVPEAARIGSVGQCATLAEGMVIVGAQGRALFTDRSAAVELVAACTTKGVAILSLQNGRELMLPCSRKLSIPDALYTVSIDPLLAALKAQQ